MIQISKKNKKEMESIVYTKESTIIQNLNTAMSPDTIDPLISSQSENKEIKTSSILTKRNDGNGKASVQTNKYVERKKKCPNCCKVILTGGKNLLRHIKACEIYSKYIQNLPNGYRCLICLDKVSERRDHIYAHIKNCKDEKLDKSVDEQESLNKQRGKLKQVYTKNDKKCENCKKIFSNQFNCKQHIKGCKIYFKYIQNVPNGYKCLICLDQVSEKRSRIYFHIKNCKEEKLEKGVDEQDFLNEQRKKLLQEYVATKKNIRKCDYCKKTFKKRIHCSQHIKTCKLYAKFFEKTSIGFNCLICLNQRTTSVHDMYRHMRDEHSDDSNFKKNKKEMESIDSSKESVILQNANAVMSPGEIDPSNALNLKNMGLETKGRITRTMIRSELKTNTRDNVTIDEIGKFKCKNCDMVSNSAPNFSRHMKGCKFYSKFFIITNAGLQCLLCPINFTGDTKGREYMRQHIRKIHFNNIDFKKVEKVMEKSESPEMNLQHMAIAMWCVIVLSPCLTEYSDPAQLSSSRATKPQRARHAATE